MRRALFISFVLVLATAGSAFAQDDEAPSETLGRALSATNEGVQAFGGEGGAPGTVTAKSLVGQGTGSQKRAAAKQLNALTENWRNMSAATKNSLPYNVAPTLFAISDTAALLAPAIEGDGKGVVSGAVNMGASSLVTAGGAAAGSSLFAAMGGTVGTFVFPVAGTAAGAAVGGAIGTVAGGFIASIAYDRYGKSIVGNFVEGGMAVLFDPDPLQDAIRAREDFLRKQAAPELQANWDYNTSVGSSYGQEEEQLFKPLTGVYTPRIAPPAATATAGESVFANVRRFELTVWNTPEYKLTLVCDVGGDKVVCDGNYDKVVGGGASTVTVHNHHRLDGTISGNEVVTREHMRGSYHWSDPGCDGVYEADSSIRHTFSADGSVTFRSLGSSGVWTSMTGRCGETSLVLGRRQVDTKQYDGKGTWRVLN